MNMAPELPNARYERKFTTTALNLAEVLALVRRHPAMFRETYPPRTVNNVYLDSAELRDYHDHLHGIARRTKTRVRWYGAWAGEIPAPTLEHKLKFGLVSGKVTRRLPPVSVNGILCGIEAVFDAANLPPLARSALRHQQPSLLNRYHRHYFQSADRRFRLTVDSGLQFAAARPAATLAASFRPPIPTLVIELKYDLAQAEQAAGVTNALPMRLARCSKYVLGIECVAA